TSADNRAGLVLEVGEGAGRALLLADVDSTVEAALEFEPRLAVIKVAHHGSASSSGESFLARARARHALVSVGRRNAFGHPAAPPPPPAAVPGPGQGHQLGPPRARRRPGRAPGPHRPPPVRRARRPRDRARPPARDRSRDTAGRALPHPARGRNALARSAARA